MSVEQLIQEGKILFQGGRVPDAIAKWQQALLRDPTNTDAQDLIKNARGVQAPIGPGERTQTLRAFTEGLQDAETSRRLAEEKLKQGIVLLKQNRTSEAVQALEAANRLDPGREEIQRALGRAKEQYLLEEKVEEIYRAGLANLESGDYTEAVTKFLRVLAADEKHARAKASLDKAKAALASAGVAAGARLPAGGAATAKDRARNLFRDGVEAFKRNELEQAVHLWQEVIRLDPSHPRAAKYREKALAVLSKKGSELSPLPTQPGPLAETEMPSISPEIAARLDDSIVWDATHQSPVSPSMTDAFSGSFRFDLSSEAPESAGSASSADSAAFDPFAAPESVGSEEPIFATEPELSEDPFSTTTQMAALQSADPFSSAVPAAEVGGVETFDVFGAPPSPAPSKRSQADPFATPVPASSPLGADPFEVFTGPAKASSSRTPSAEPFASAPSLTSAEPFDPFSEVVAKTAAAARPAEPPFGAKSPGDPFDDVSFQIKKNELDRDAEELAEIGRVVGDVASAKPQISFVAADFLSEVRASPPHTTAPPPSWLDSAATQEAPFEVSEAPAAEAVPSPEALLEEGRRSMGDERYEEAINTFKKVLERAPQDSDGKALLDRAMQCLGARDQLAHALEQAEQASASGDWEAAARHAAKTLQINPYLRRAQQIATQAHSLAPGRVAAPAESPRGPVAGAPVINPFAVKKSVNPLAPKATKPTRPRRWPVVFVALILVGTGAFFMAQKWQETLDERAKAQRAEELRRRQQQDAQQQAKSGQQAIEGGSIVQGRDLLVKAATLDPQNKEIKTSLQKAQTSLDQKAQPFLDQATQDLERSDYDKAISGAISALKIDPANARAKAIQTTAARYRDSVGTSEEKIFRISNFQKYVERGDEAFDKKRYDEAQDFYQVALELSPHNDVAENRIAKVTSKIGELHALRNREGPIIDEALKLLEDRKYKAALDKINGVLEAVPDSAKAKAALEKVQAALDRQKNLDLYKKMALQFYQLGKDAQALEYFKKWYDLEPDSREAKFYIDQLKQAGN
jgi:tetratricopeptide (TPR) repeat protein